MVLTRVKPVYYGTSILLSQISHPTKILHKNRNSEIEIPTIENKQYLEIQSLK